MKYAAIADWAEEKEYSVTFMCEQLGVVRQGYYRWRSAGPCERERTDAELTEQILGSTPSWTAIPACAGSGPSSPRAGYGSRPSASGG